MFLNDIYYKTNGLKYLKVGENKALKKRYVSMIFLMNLNLVWLRYSALRLFSCFFTKLLLSYPEMLLKSYLNILLKSYLKIIFKKLF